MDQPKITEAIAKAVLTTVDAGLVAGVGKPVPGQMCVEAAVCYALGLPHGDDPICVSRALRTFKITLNDADWSSSSARAKGLRRLAVAQLGSRGVLDDVEFAKRIADLAVREWGPKCADAARSAADAAVTATYAANAAARARRKAASFAARSAAAYASAARSAAASTADAADAARYAATSTAAARYAGYIAYAAAYDKALSDAAESVVQILIEMKAPGCQWLSLTEENL